MATAALAVCAIQAQGAPPTVTQGAITFPVQQFDDPDVCASAGFTIHAVENESLRFTFRFDDTGQFLSGIAHHDISFEISANGRTIHESDHYTNFFAPDGTSAAAGNESHIVGENGGIVLLDAGRIVFDMAGNPSFIAGRHPQFLGATFCSALAG